MSLKDLDKYNPGKWKDDPGGLNHALLEDIFKTNAGTALLVGASISVFIFVFTVTVLVRLCQ